MNRHMRYACPAGRAEYDRRRSIGIPPPLDLPRSMAEKGQTRSSYAATKFAAGSVKIA
jgi:hypothetical protein